MIRYMLRPFLPQTWMAHSPTDFSTQAVEKKVKTILAESEAEYDFGQFSLASFAQWVEEKRCRPIHFIPFHMPSTPSGVWFQLSTEDWIFFDEDTLPIHQTHIQLHELSHMLCGHGAVDLGDTSDQETILQLMHQVLFMVESYDDLAKDNPQMLFRWPRSVPEEMEAELLSELILERVSTRQFEKVLAQPITFSRMAVDVYEAMGIA